MEFRSFGHLWNRSVNKLSWANLLWLKFSLAHLHSYSSKMPGIQEGYWNLALVGVWLKGHYCNNCLCFMPFIILFGWKWNWCNCQWGYASSIIGNLCFLQWGVFFIFILNVVVMYYQPLLSNPIERLWKRLLFLAIHDSF